MNILLSVYINACHGPMSDTAFISINCLLYVANVERHFMAHPPSLFSPVNVVDLMQTQRRHHYAPPLTTYSLQQHAQLKVSGMYFIMNVHVHPQYRHYRVSTQAQVER